MLRSRLGLLTHETLVNPLVAMHAAFSGGRLAGIKEPLRLPTQVSAVSAEASFSSVGDFNVRDLVTAGLASNFDEKSFFAELMHIFVTLMQLPDLRQLNWGASSLVGKAADSGLQVPGLVVLRDIVLSALNQQPENLRLDLHNSCLVECNDDGYNDDVSELTRQGVASTFMSGYLGLAASAAQPAGMAAACFSQNLLGLPRGVLTGFFFFIYNYSKAGDPGTPGWLTHEVGAQSMQMQLSGHMPSVEIPASLCRVLAVPKTPRHARPPQLFVVGGTRRHAAPALACLLRAVLLITSL